MKYYFSQSEARRSVGTVHALGTGRVLVYGQGPEWMQVIGAPYSSPSVLSLRFPDTEEYFSVSERTEGTSAWQHSISVRQAHRNTREMCGTFTDIACRGAHTILRSWQLTRPTVLQLLSEYPITDVSALFDRTLCAAALSVSVPQNAPVFRDHPVGMPTTVMLGIRCAEDGFCTLTQTPEGMALTLAGTGCIYVCGGAHFPGAHAALARALTHSPDALARDQRTADAAYLAVCAGNRARCGCTADHDGAVAAAIEDVLFSLRAQQSEQGGVMAGYDCHLARARDQYGVLRGMLSMGDFAGARAILQYFLNTEREWGTFQSAQGMGGTRIFHIHENDNTGIPAYPVLGCIAYLNKTGDLSFFAQCLGLCGRAMARMIPELVGGMMPFSGEEPCIADGFLPRTVIEHGSLAATALFAAAAEQLESACDAIGLPKDALPADLHTHRAAAELSFDENFARRGGYAVNAPRRAQLCSQPLYRYGVCCFCGAFGWLYGVDRGCYACPGCTGKTAVPDDTEYRLHAPVLVLPYIGSALLGRPALAHTVRGLLSAYRRSGCLLSAGSSDIGGCDFGLVLHAAAAVGEDADDLLSAALEARDASGMWSESCDLSCGKAVPHGMRCFPMASAVNMDGILAYLSGGGDRNR